VVINGNGKFTHWLSSGLIATIAWFVVLIIYCVFRAVGIEDPLLGQAFLLLTGAWVGNLTLAQGKKQARAEEKAEVVSERVDRLVEGSRESARRVNEIEHRAEAAENRADESEAREGEWSQHRDHAGDRSPKEDDNS
jgi:hypothetical protein